VKKRLLITFVVIDSLIVLAVVAIILLLPSMDRWGSTEAERAAGLPGDELVPSPARIVNRGSRSKLHRNRSTRGWYSSERAKAASTATPPSKA
jgi:hypothetical protein